MDIKQIFADTLKTKKFDGITVHVQATGDSRLQVRVEASGSVDLPGNMDEMVGQIANLFGLGNSPKPLPPSPPSAD